mgnify:CR=1 FL=1
MEKKEIICRLHQIDLVMSEICEEMYEKKFIFAASTWYHVGVLQEKLDNLATHLISDVEKEEEGKPCD